LEFCEQRALLSLPGLVSPTYILYHPAGRAKPAAGSGPVGYTPAQISNAYGFKQISLNGAGQTIAIVDAYDDPSIASDLHVFDLQFGLADPTLVKVNQSGGTSYPARDPNWAVEISLDVEWAHAMAPGARILLIEANSNSFSDLLAAVDYARSQPGVSAVSMSWYASEFSGETSLDSHFTTPSGHAGVTFVACSGDTGIISYPAASPNVLAVGGTTLTIGSGNTYGGETAWSGSGGGISAYEPTPSYQLGLTSSGHRTNPDVAYDADPNPGFAIYDSYGSVTPWQQVGGTSAGAPQWAALIALANQGRATRGLGTLDGPSQTLPLLYEGSGYGFHDIISGSNQHFSAGPGYDMVTGWGTPSASVIANQLVNLSGIGLEVFAVGSDHAVYTQTQAVPDGPFSGWSSLGGWFSQITVATNFDGRLELFGVGAYGLPYTKVQLSPGGAWSGWTYLGGAVSQMSVARNADGRLEVFGIGTNSAPYADVQLTPGGGWSGWANLGGLVTQLTAARNADGRLELVGIGTDGAAYYDVQLTPGGGWSGWAGLGGWVSQISVGAASDGRLELFGIGSDHALYYQVQVTPGGRWSGWGPLGGWVSSIFAPYMYQSSMNVFNANSHVAVTGQEQAVLGSPFGSGSQSEPAIVMYPNTGQESQAEVFAPSRSEAFGAPGDHAVPGSPRKDRSHSHAR
jgi:hypothetical protein